MNSPICSVCHCAFETNETLYSRVSIAHASAKQFSCYLCVRSFPIINSWRKHIRKEHANFNARNMMNLQSNFVAPIEQSNFVAPIGQSDDFSINVGSLEADADDYFPDDEHFSYQYSRFINSNDSRTKPKENFDVPFKSLIKDGSN